MKQNRFIELLNLYVDGALPPDGAAELEREIATDPARRKVYRQYCLMQRACTVLAERFRGDAAPAADFRHGQLAGASTVRTRNGWRAVVLAASGAVAACFVFVAVQSQFPGPSQAQVAGPAAPPTHAVHPPPQVIAVANPSNPEFPLFIRDSWRQLPTRSLWTGEWEGLSFTRTPSGLPVSPLDQFRGLPIQPVNLETVPIMPPCWQTEDVEAAAFQFQR